MFCPCFIRRRSTNTDEDSAPSISSNNVDDTPNNIGSVNISDDFLPQQSNSMQMDTTPVANLQTITNNTNEELLIQYQEENTNLRNQIIILQTENTTLKQIIEAAKQTAETAMLMGKYICSLHSMYCTA